MKAKISQLIISPYLSSCGCQCRHCLLEGQEAMRKMKEVEALGKLAFRLQEEIQGNFPIFINPYRSMEYKELPQVIAWNRQLGHTHTHVNVNGTRMRSGKDLFDWVVWLKDECRIDTVEVSWFGRESFMDEFVHCKGYFSYLTRLSKAIRENGIRLEHKVFVMNSNLEMLPELCNHLEQLGGVISPAFIDYRGYGKGLVQEYLNEDKLKNLPIWVRESYLLKSGRYSPEKEWICQIQKGCAPLPSKMTLFLVVDSKTNEIYKNLTYKELIEVTFDRQRKLEKILPCTADLAALYGNQEGGKYYEYRSLILKWQEQYIMEYAPEKKELLFSDLKTGCLWR